MGAFCEEAAFSGCASWRSWRARGDGVRRPCSRHRRFHLACRMLYRSRPPVSFEIRPVLTSQAGSCAGGPAGVPGIRGGCYQLAARLGVTVSGAQQAVVVPDPAGGVIVLIVIGPDQWSAFQRMMQPPPGALPPPDPSQGDIYQVPARLAFVQHGEVLAAFPALLGTGPPGTPVRLQVDGLRGRGPMIWCADSACSASHVRHCRPPVTCRDSAVTSPGPQRRRSGRRSGFPGGRWGHAGRDDLRTAAPTPQMLPQPPRAWRGGQAMVTAQRCRPRSSH